ncbi:MAG: ParB/RepB/Spo0J family partition protein [Desulfobacterales bacterium]
MKKLKETKKAGPRPGKAKKMALGKGLEALIPDMEMFGDTDEDPNKAMFECAVERIIPNRYQPRERFSPEELEELSLSIAEQGILQPLLVRKAGSNYELIAGERRFRAAKLAGLSTIPVIVKEVSDTGLLELSIIENIQRENLNPIEEAEAYHRLMNEFGMTQDQASKRLGKSRSAIANILRLRNLPDDIKASITDGRLTMGHARALLGAKNTAQQMAAWRTVMDKGLSVRQTEALIDLLKKEADNPPSPASKPTSDDIYFQNLAEDLSRDFGTKVLIQRSGKRGKVVFEYYSDDELDRLLGIFRNTQEPG